MPRRGKTSPAEDLIDLVALMPWWVGVVLAVVIYLVLHSVASSPLPSVSSPTQASSVMVNSVWRGLAYGGQYILPFLCLLGALTSFLRRRKRQGLHEDVRRSNAPDALERMSWREFEMLVGEGFRQRGYTVQESGGGGPDGGVDLLLRKDGETFLVQCKQWKAFKVSVSVVRELYGVMAARGAAGGLVVTSGQFTEEAEAFAQGRNIRLFSGAALLQLIQSGRMASSQVPSAPPVDQKPVAPAALAAPACPICSKSMVRRVAKRGATAGSAFWGCTAYPGCRGTRPL